MVIKLMVIKQQIRLMVKLVEYKQLMEHIKLVIKELFIQLFLKQYIQLFQLLFQLGLILKHCHRQLIKHIQF